MNKWIQHLLAMVFLASLSMESMSQWVQTNGPYGGNVSSFAVSPNGAGGTTDPRGPSTNTSRRSMRGGSFNSNEYICCDIYFVYFCEVALHYDANTGWHGPHDHNKTFGFRCVRK